MTIIMVAIQGGDYATDWGGNFRIGIDTYKEYEGFKLAEEQVYSALKGFISKNKSRFNSNVKVWITGFSRVAATSNLLAAHLNDEGLKELPGLKKKDTFAFCFETP